MHITRFDSLFLDYPEPVRPLAEPEPLGGAGGHSGSRLWRYRAAAGEFVLRAWPGDGPSRAHLERVHHWLTLTADLGFTPVPIPDSSGQSLRQSAGRLWEIAPWLTGAPDSSQAPSREHLRAAFTALAALHRRLADHGQLGISPGLVERYQSIRQLIAGGFDVLERVCTSERERECGTSDGALRWIKLARLFARDVENRLRLALRNVVVLQPCLRDARPDHFLFDGGRVSGLVDFGAMDIETVAGDLARLLAEWLEGDSIARRDALAAYEAARPLDPPEAALIDVFESATAILIGERWARWHYLENRQFDDPLAITRGLQKSSARLERLLQTTMGTALLQ
jgi:homoserine kinase type II